MLPYAFRDADLSIWKLTLYVRSSGDVAGGGAAVSLSCPQPGQDGEFTPTLLYLEEVDADIEGLARYDADLLASTDVHPVPFGTGGSASTWRLKFAAGPDYRDVVLALWCADLDT
jgi:hypothetical protein